MAPYTAYLIGPGGAGRHIDILAADIAHARELARAEGRALYGRRPFTYTVRPA